MANKFTLETLLVHTANPLLSQPPPFSPGGAYLFQAYLRGDLIETGGLIWERELP